METLIPILLVAALVFIGVLIFLAVRPPRMSDAAPVTKEQEPVDPSAVSRPEGRPRA